MYLPPLTPATKHQRIAVQPNSTGPHIPRFGMESDRFSQSFHTPVRPLSPWSKEFIRNLPLHDKQGQPYPDSITTATLNNSRSDLNYRSWEQDPIRQQGGYSEAEVTAELNQIAPERRIPIQPVNHIFNWVGQLWQPDETGSDTGKRSHADAFSDDIQVGESASSIWGSSPSFIFSQAGSDPMPHAPRPNPFAIRTSNTQSQAAHASYTQALDNTPIPKDTAVPQELKGKVHSTFQFIRSNPKAASTQVPGGAGAVMHLRDDLAKYNLPFEVKNISRSGIAEYVIQPKQRMSLPEINAIPKDTAVPQELKGRVHSSFEFIRNNPKTKATQVPGGKSAIEHLRDTLNRHSLPFEVANVGMSHDAEYAIQSKQGMPLPEINAIPKDTSVPQELKGKVRLTFEFIRNNPKAMAAQVPGGAVAVRELRKALIRHDLLFEVPNIGTAHDARYIIQSKQGMPLVEINAIPQDTPAPPKLTNKNRTVFEFIRNNPKAMTTQISGGLDAVKNLAATLKRYSLPFEVKNVSSSKIAKYVLVSKELNEEDAALTHPTLISQMPHSVHPSIRPAGFEPVEDSDDCFYDPERDLYIFRKDDGTYEAIDDAGQPFYYGALSQNLYPEADWSVSSHHHSNPANSVAFATEPTQNKRRRRPQAEDIQPQISRSNELQEQNRLLHEMELLLGSPDRNRRNNQGWTESP